MRHVYVFKKRLTVVYKLQYFRVHVWYSIMVVFWVTPWCVPQLLTLNWPLSFQLSTVDLLVLLPLIVQLFYPQMLFQPYHAALKLLPPVVNCCTVLSYFEYSFYRGFLTFLTILRRVDENCFNISRKSIIWNEILNRKILLLLIQAITFIKIGNKKFTASGLIPNLVVALKSSVEV